MSAINPVLVIRNNLPEYKAELAQELEVLYDRAHVIEDELRTIARLEAALNPNQETPCS